MARFGGFTVRRFVWITLRRPRREWVVPLSCKCRDLLATCTCHVAHFFPSGNACPSEQPPSPMTKARTKCCVSQLSVFLRLRSLSGHFICHLSNHSGWSGIAFILNQLFLSLYNPICKYFKTLLLFCFGSFWGMCVQEESGRWGFRKNSPD